MGMSFCSGRVDSISWPPLSISKAVFVSMLLVARPQLYLVIEQPCSSWAFKQDFMVELSTALKLLPGVIIRLYDPTIPNMIKLYLTIFNSVQGWCHIGIYRIHMNHRNPTFDHICSLGLGS